MTAGCFLVAMSRSDGGQQTNGVTVSDWARSDRGSFMLCESPGEGNRIAFSIASLDRNGDVFTNSTPLKVMRSEMAAPACSASVDDGGLLCCLLAGHRTLRGLEFDYYPQVFLWDESGKRVRQLRTWCATLPNRGVRVAMAEPGSIRKLLKGALDSRGYQGGRSYDRPLRNVRLQSRGAGAFHITGVLGERFAFSFLFECHIEDASITPSKLIVTDLHTIRGNPAARG